MYSKNLSQVNEELDSGCKNADPTVAFQGDPEQFKKYHEAYRKRVEHWPKNPLHVIIKWAKKKLKVFVIHFFYRLSFRDNIGLDFYTG